MASPQNMARKLSKVRLGLELDPFSMLVDKDMPFGLDAKPGTLLPGVLLLVDVTLPESEPVFSIRLGCARDVNGIEGCFRSLLGLPGD